MRPILKGSTDQSVVIRIVDSGDGTPETGVVFNTSGIDLWYRREGATKTSITEATLSALNDAHSDGGVLHIGDGYYRLDLPDAAVASGANGVMVGGTVTGMVVIGCYVPLLDVNLYDGVRMGLTALPNAAAEASGGLFTRGTGAGQINQAANGMVDANAVRHLGTAYATPTVAGVPEVDLTHWNGTAVATPDTNGYPKVTIKSGTGTGEISLSSGGVSVRGNIKKAAAFAKLMFLMTDSTNHNPATGKTVTVTISKDGGSFASLNSADTVTEVANGLYEVDLDATDTNFNNAVLRATATACDDTLVHLFSEV